MAITIKLLKHGLIFLNLFVLAFNLHIVTTEKRVESTKPTENINSTVNDQTSLPTTTEGSVTTGSKSFTTNKVIDDKCAEYGKCSFVSGLKRPYCRCDQLCSEYKECCSDVIPKAFNATIYYDHRVCYPRGGPDLTSLYTQISGIYVVASCPNAPSPYLERCHNHSVALRGTMVVSRENITFLNEFCARCHGVTEYRFFSLKFYPTREEFEALLIDSKPEDFNFRNGVKYKMIEPTDAEVRSCISNTNEIDTPLCRQSPTNLVKDDEELYKNIFCTPSNIPNVQCVGYYLDYATTTFELFPLTVLFNVNAMSTTTKEDECESWSAEVEEMGLCQNENTYVNIDIKLQPFNITSTRPLEGYDYLMMGLIYGWALEVSQISSLYEIRVFKNENSTIVFYDILHLKLTKRIFLRELERFEKRFNDFSWRATFIDKTTNQTAELVKTRDASGTGSGIPVRNFMVRGKLAQQLQSFNVKSPESPQQICEDMELLITRTDSETNLEIKECRIAAKASEIHDEPKSSTTQTILTYCFFSVSAIALIVLVVINRKFTIATGAAGTNLNNLSASLLAANVAFMLGVGNNDYAMVCYVISILLHYLWLVVFTFMSIGVICIEANLTKIQRQSSISKNQRLLTLGGLVIPLVFVAAAVIVDNTGPKDVSPGYGRSVCFPNQYPGNLIFFTGPIMLSLLINLVVLSLIIFKAYKINQETKNVTKRSVMTNGQIFLRIICLSNVFWVTGILASILDLEWLGLVFINLCGLHGFFIAVASLTTNQARKQMTASATTTSTRFTEKSNSS